MKLLIRLFFKAVRLIVGPILLLIERLTAPRGIVRTPEKQQSVDLATQQLLIYQFKTCPFCIKVRRECRRLSLRITMRDAQHDAAIREELNQATGKVQVPCLRITAPDGNVTWMLESNLIIAYLRARFAS